MEDDLLTIQWCSTTAWLEILPSWNSIRWLLTIFINKCNHNSDPDESAVSDLVDEAIGSHCVAIGNDLDAKTVAHKQRKLFGHVVLPLHPPVDL